MVIDAIAAGRRGALAIDKYLKGDTSRVKMYDLRADALEESVLEEVAAAGGEEDWQPQFRPEIPVLPLAERKILLRKQNWGFPKKRPDRKRLAV